MFPKKKKNGNRKWDVRGNVSKTLVNGLSQLKVRGD
jgi:hypothetical protein